MLVEHPETLPHVLRAGIVVGIRNVEGDDEHVVRRHGRNRPIVHG
jgi:hypothetical protein